MYSIEKAQNAKLHLMRSRLELISRYPQVRESVMKGCVYNPPKSPKVPCRALPKVELPPTQQSIRRLSAALRAEFDEMLDVRDRVRGFALADVPPLPSGGEGETQAGPCSAD